MTDPEAEAVAWAKEHPAITANIGPIVSVPACDRRAENAYAAGVEAGREAERTRVCRWIKRPSDIEWWETAGVASR